MQDPYGKHNVIHIVDSFEFRGHLCICFELMSHSLYDFMRLHDFQGLNMQLVHRFAVQLLSTLCFLNAEGIIHCDLKPENILLQNSKYSNIKVSILPPA
jgi:dual specificity tyrosine-phosphorylation-regulated kinase 2/3/4